MSLKVFLLKYGKAVVLNEVSLVNVPGLVVKPTVKFLVPVIPVTSYSLLYPEFKVAVVLVELLILTNWTLEPTERLCGSSVTTLTFVPSHVASAINLKFLC